MAENLENLASDNGDFLDPYVVKKKEPPAIIKMAN